MQETLTKEQFCERFVAHMTKQSPFTCFKNEDGTDAETVAEYAEATAPTYWDDLHQRAEGPEECAAADMSYWGE